MKKILMVLIVLLSIIIPNCKVEALEDSFYEGEYISGEYIKKFRGNSGRYQQMKVFRRSSDNLPVYCIELWEALSSNKLVNGYDNEQYNYANIDYATWEKIMLISYYGYGYKNHTDIKWYAITQFMIWQVTSPDSNIYFTDTLNGNKIIKYQNEIDEINNLIINHANMPSFNNETFIINYKESYTAVDSNNVLEKFDITSDGGLIVNKNDNQLIVYADSMNDSSIFFVNKDKKYNTNPIVYVDPTGQDVLAAGSYYPIYMVVNYHIPKSTITIDKKDFDTKTSNSQGDSKLVGSKFQLLDIDNQIIQEKIINEDSSLTFENVGYGKYFIKEIAAGEGYLLNNEIVSLKVDEKIEKVTFYNKVIKNKISFQKYIKNPLTNVIKKEANAIFSIYNSNNKKITTFTTDKNGYYDIELPYGKYIVKQESGVKNHSLVKDFEIEIVVNNKIQSFDLYNQELIANVKIINTDFDSNLPILEEGALFKIKNLSTNKYITDKNGEDLILETNNFGIYDSLTLSSGKYQLEQIKAVDNYEINEEIITFEISDDIEFLIDENNNKYLEIIVSNIKQKGKIKIIKYIEYYMNDELIKMEMDNNIFVSVYAKEDIYSKDGLKVYQKDEEIKITKLENNELITELLVFGNYYLKNIDNTIVEVRIDNKNTKIIELLVKFYDYNENKLDGEESIIQKEEIKLQSSVIEDLNDNKVENIEIKDDEVIIDESDDIKELEEEKNSLFENNEMVENVIVQEELIENDKSDEPIISNDSEVKTNESENVSLDKDVVDEITFIDNVLEDNDVIIEVPDTYFKQSIIYNINIFFMLLGLLLIGCKYEIKD